MFSMTCDAESCLKIYENFTTSVPRKLYILWEFDQLRMEFFNKEEEKEKRREVVTFGNHIAKNSSVYYTW